jgi:signal transduction histidine kinase
VRSERETTSDGDGLDRESALTLALLDRNAAIRRVVANTAEALDVEVAFAALVVDDLDTLQVVATAGTWSLGDLVIPAGRGLGGRVALLRHPIAVDDYAAAPEITHDFDVQVAQEGIRALAAAPITHGHLFLGVLYGGSREPGALGRGHVQHLARLARQAGLALGVADRAQDMADVAVHEERRRVALALHDSLGATLFSIGAAVRTLRADVGPDGQLAERLAYIEEQTALASATVRRTLLALSTSPSEIALGVALQSDCRAFAERTGIESRALAMGTLPNLAPTQTRELLLATREALLNVEKHSQARSVIVTAYAADGGVSVVITDDGVGPATSTNGDGLGLMAARERLSRLGGRLQIDAGDEGGCTVRAWIPA